MRQGQVLAGMVMLIAVCLLLCGNGWAQDGIDGPSSTEDVFSEPAREQWLARVAEAKRRAREFALEQRMRTPASAADLSAEQERLASESVMNDSSLQRGDIVSTNKGLFVFRGATDQEHREGDFVALPQR